MTIFQLSSAKKKQKANIRKQDQKGERTVGTQYQSVFIMLLVSLFLFGAIGSRLAHLQLVNGKKFTVQADNNRIRIIPKPPIRGNIFDRHGKVLATTRLSYSAFVWPIVQKKENWPITLKRLSQILAIPEAEIQRTVEQADYNSPTLIRIARNLTTAQMTAMEEYHQELEGVKIDIESLRYYPHKELASHVLGYTREIDAETLKEKRSEGYRMGDIIGKMGVEAAFESQLRGEWGGQQVEVNGAGKTVRLLEEIQPKAGHDVALTLDLEVQKAAEAALGDKLGAIVALDPRDGGVLAMVSNPKFDPNIFSGRVTPEVWKKLQAKGDPFINRAMRGFPPASTFKIVTATAGMETGKYPPHVILRTSAYIAVAGVRFHDWNRAGFGPIGYITAMAMSSNTFFGQVGRGVGGPALIDWARRYGFGERTGIELPDEAKGLIADGEWKKRVYNWDWSEGDTVNMSIGQGFTQATPLQLAVMFAVPANKGYRVKPHLLKDNRDAKEWRQSLNLKPSTVETLRKGLRQVVAGGTGKALNTPTLPPAAGKSGTAEAPPKQVHTWFGGFAPYDNPEIVVVAFGEHSGGGGGSVQGPKVRQVMEAYFQKKAPKSSSANQ
jgi:penicillin-binding protein 2